MKKVIFSLLCIFTQATAFAVDLKVGDVLLQPLDCWSCSLIEAEEETIYSHAAIVLKTTPEVLVAEALGSIHLISLKSFMNRTEAGQKVSVRRIVNEEAVSELQRNRLQLLMMYWKWFDKHEYDDDFLWNNFSANGEEKFYCTEMITKLLKGFLGIDLPVKRMHFDVNRESWIEFFKGHPPDQQFGNSPGDFERSEWFHEVGEL